MALGLLQSHSRVAVMALVAGLYFASGKVGLLFATEHDNVTLIWPPSGVALVALLLYGPRVIPAVWLGAFLVNITTDISLFSALGIATGNMLEAGIAWWLLNQKEPFDTGLRRIRDAIRLLFFAALVATLCSASIGVLTLVLLQGVGSASAPVIWLDWWLGDALGIVVVVPVFLVWWHAGLSFTSPGQRREFLFVCLSWTILLLLVFAWPIQNHPMMSLLAFLPFPVVIWSGWRFGRRGAVTMALIFALAALIGSAMGHTLLPAGDDHQRLILLHSFITLLFLVGLLSSIAQHQQRIHAAQLQTVNRDYALVMHASPALIWHMDDQLRVTQANDRALQVLNLKANEIMGKTLFDFFPDSHARTYHRENLEVLERRSPARGVVELGPGEEGTHWYRNDRIPLYDDEGCLLSLTLFMTDVTETKRAEDALRQNEAFYRSLVESTLAVPWKLDLKSLEFTYMGQQIEKMLGYPVDSWRDLEAWKQRLHSDDRDEATRSFLESGLRGDSQEFEYRAVHADGHTVWVRDVVSVLMGSDGPKELQGFMFDISADKKHQVQLRAAKETAEIANRAKSEFLATMSHEIRTPMNVVIGMGDLLMESALDEHQQHYVERLQRAGGTLLDLINDILDLSKIESGSLELECKPFSPQYLLASVGELFSVEAQAKGVRLEWGAMLAKLPEQWVGDEVRLRQILINLLGNALKFTDQGEVVLMAGLDTRPEGEWLVFEVHDSGIGMDQTQIARIFDAFTQADSSITRRYGGTGLGLAITRRLIKKMHGSLWVNSEPEHGSLFTVQLPRCAEVSLREKAPQTPVLPAVVPSSSRPMRVLLAEDSEDNRLLIDHYLKGSPHQLKMAVNGQEALALVKQQPFDLILMDMQMPIMDGYSAVRAIRAYEKEQQVAPSTIVALTAHALQGDAQKSLDAGCDEHLTKPIKKQVLLGVLQAYAVQLGQKS
ncbi:MASE1 domain-containing protein [Magnetococcus sp. PR-3]|uniref:MASE1 domain-containing protein n=1 Tax=Magnetococcus sp. PR-3 TaxID=3120355 RepID=UPI002FCDFA69